MSTLLTHALADLASLHLSARSAESASFAGRPALRLDGLALLPELAMEQGTLEVEIAAEGPAYPGLVFCAADTLNYELAYTQPHTSGAWDALQYDPVFHGANTWQLYHGEAYQRATEVPTGRWFTLRVAFQGRRASISVDGQAPLVVEGLAHGRSGGLVGLWTYLPAYFRNLRASPGVAIPEQGHAAAPPLGAPWRWVDAWFVEGYGVAACEPNGALNLYRYLPSTLLSATLTRRLAVAQETDVELALGYGDVLDLALDDEPLYHGENRFKPSPLWEERGYVAPGHRLRLRLAPGEHRLSAVVQVDEPFGWGLTLAWQGEGVTLLPAALG